LNVNLAIPKGDLVPLKRALFLTVGSAARTMAETCLALGQDWLQTEPPLEIVDFAAVDADETYLAAAWTRLANAERIEALAERGFPIDRQEEIALWLLLDVSCWQPGGDGAATG